MQLFPSQGGPIYFKWWFWVVLVFLVCGTLYAVRYTSWNAQYLSDHAEEFARNSAINVLNYQNAQIEKQYKEDQYGGATPEETLKLFVEALEKKDFVLASKYYVPEKQSEILKQLNSGKVDATNPFINAYKTGTNKSFASKDTNDYEIDTNAAGEKIPFITSFMKNPFTNKWKITD